MLWDIDPYTLLQKIENSVTDLVYEHIRSAWVMKDPHEALSSIWKILEDLYGDPLGIFENTALRLSGKKAHCQTRFYLSRPIEQSFET